MDTAPSRKPVHVLVVDDEPSQRETLQLLLNREGYETATVGSGREALEHIAHQEPDLILSDIRMPELDGMALLRSLKDAQIDSEIILLTAYANAEDAVEAMKAGAYDYLIKPYRFAELRVLIAKALEKRSLRVENRSLRGVLEGQLSRSGDPVACSPSMIQLLDQLRHVATLDTTVLLTGESGVGKEIFARYVWRCSERAGSPFVAVNCGAIPDNLVESELFGSDRGAFTGADKARPGLFEQADGGTLFLDEIGELPLPVQVKLLRVLQERTLRRLGSERERSVDVRIVCATNRDLEQMVEENLFRKDLFYRINVFRAHIPPLRERREDIPLLLDHFLRLLGGRYPHSAPTFRLSNDDRRYLDQHAFPGNVRELENWIERQLLLSESKPGPVPDPGNESSGEPSASTDDLVNKVLAGEVSLERALENLEREMILAALTATGGQKMEAAEKLGMSFRQFRYKSKKYKIEVD